MGLDILWVEDLLSSNTNLKVLINFARVVKASRLSKLGSKFIKYINQIKNIQWSKLFINNKIQNLQNLQNLQKINQNNKQVHQIQKQIQNRNITRVSTNYIKRQSKYSNQLIQKNNQQNDPNNILKRFQNCIQLPPIIRKNVNIIQLKQIQQKWKQISQRNHHRKKKNKNQIKNTQSIGNILKQSIQKSIVLMIVGLIIILPLLSAETWFSRDLNIQSHLLSIFENITLQNQKMQYQMLKSYIDMDQNQYSCLISLQIPINKTCCKYPKDFPKYIIPQVHQDLRLAQMITTNIGNVQVIYSTRQLFRFKAKLQLIRDAFMIVLLMFSSILFMKDIQIYALNPMQQMTKTIQKISENPFKAIKQIKPRNIISSQKLQANILQDTIIKLTNFLVIGAGQIGSQLIINSIQDQYLNPNKFESKNIFGAYMYVGIANFEKIITNMLGQDLINYINYIAEIVHRYTIKYNGHIIQNDGNGFLLCWPLKDQQSVNNQNNNIINDNKIYHNLQIEMLADLAIACYIQISIELAKSKKLNYYNIKQKICCGIHVGLTVQGIIGSKFKLQSKFIGQNISITRNLSKISQFYGLTNLISQDLFLLTSLSMKDQLRKIDKILGINNIPIKIYTIDLYLQQIQSKQNQKGFIIQQLQTNVKESYNQRYQLFQILKNVSVIGYLRKNLQFIRARKCYSLDFFDCWAQGLQYYLQGDWEKAQSLFKNYNKIAENLGGDSPANTFLKIIQTNDGFAPQNWKAISQFAFKWQ